MRSLTLLVLASCAPAPRPTTTTPPAPAAVRAVPPAERVPGAIAGAWRVTCAENQGEIIDITVDGGKAVGRVAEPGVAARYGFRKGEEVFRLAANPAGEWAGEVHWRGVSGAEHWDGIVLAATQTTLTATITNEPCYRDMPRAR